MWQENFTQVLGFTQIYERVFKSSKGEWVKAYVFFLNEQGCTKRDHQPPSPTYITSWPEIPVAKQN